jgi:hypothetical protein
MLHRYFRWRYERQSRSGAFKLPKSRKADQPENSNLSHYLSHSSGLSRSFRPFDLAHKRRKLAQFVALFLVIALIAWVTYESLVALALIAR